MLYSLIIIGCEVKDPYETVAVKNGFNVDSCEYLYKKYQQDMQGMTIEVTEGMYN